MTDETLHIATAAAILDVPYAALSQPLHGDGEIDRQRVKRLLYENTSLTSEQAEQVMGCLPPASTLMALASTQLAAQVRRKALEEAFSEIADYPRAAPSEDEWMRYDEQIEHSQGIIRALIDATPASNVTPAERDVLAERQRQIKQEGWSEDRDDGYREGQLAAAAACYTINVCEGGDPEGEGRPPFGWPWSRDWWKPTNPRRDLVKAGALILAEIERLDRAAQDRGDDT